MHMRQQPPNLPEKDRSTLADAAASAVDLIQIAVGINARCSELHVETRINVIVLVEARGQPNGRGSAVIENYKR